MAAPAEREVFQEIRLEPRQLVVSARAIDKEREAPAYSSRLTYFILLFICFLLKIIDIWLRSKHNNFSFVYWFSMQASQKICSSSLESRVRFPDGKLF